MANYNTYLLDKNGKVTTDLTEGDLYVSVSTILKMEGKDLVTWALRTFGGEEEPMKAYQAYMDKVSGLGSRLHAYVEHDLKGEHDVADAMVREDMLAAVTQWHTFRDNNDIRLVASERIVYSPKYRVAGTCDLVCELNGDLFVGDFKTGKIYPSAFCQMAAYWSFMCEEPKKSRIKGIEKAGLLGIHLPRDGGPVKAYTLEEYYDNKMTMKDELGIFHALRFLWAKRNLKSRKWEAVIKNMADVMSPLEEKFKQAFDL